MWPLLLEIAAQVEMAARWKWHPGYDKPAGTQSTSSDPVDPANQQYELFGSEELKATSS